MNFGFIWSFPGDKCFNITRFFETGKFLLTIVTKTTVQFGLGNELMNLLAFLPMSCSINNFSDVSNIQKKNISVVQFIECSKSTKV